MNQESNQTDAVNIPHGTECQGTTVNGRPCLGGGWLGTRDKNGNLSTSPCQCRQAPKDRYRRFWVSKKLNFSGSSETMFDTGACILFSKGHSIYIRSSADIRGEIVKIAGLYTGPELLVTEWKETESYFKTHLFPELKIRGVSEETGEGLFHPGWGGLWIIKDAETLVPSKRVTKQLDYIIAGARSGFYKIVIHSTLPQQEFINRHSLKEGLKEPQQ